MVTLGPLGYMPFPGTVGSLATVPVILCINYLEIPPQIFIVLMLICIVAALFVITRAQKYFTHADPREIIIDEVVGCMIALYALPMSLNWIVPAFILFRILDGTKICGLAYIEKKVSGAYGIMCDDIVAGLMVLISMRCLMVLFP